MSPTRSLVYAALLATATLLSACATAENRGYVLVHAP